MNAQPDGAAVDATTSLRCPGPACGGTMLPDTRSGVTADRCDRCSSLWFDASELDAWLADGAPESVIPRRGPGARRCPRACDGSMETAGWTDLVLDRCPTCRGLFVEAREIGDLEQFNLPTESQSIESRLQVAMVSAGWTLLSAKGIIILILRFLR
jgi:Zn-finger nucleic acid-binding protein